MNAGSWKTNNQSQNIIVELRHKVLFLRKSDNYEFPAVSVCEAYGQKLVILTNTLFNEVDSNLVATIQCCEGKNLLKGLHIPIILDEEPCYVDLLDIATISKKQMKTPSKKDLQFYRAEIKSGLDLLIDGF